MFVHPSPIMVKADASAPPMARAPTRKVARRQVHEAHRSQLRARPDHHIAEVDFGGTAPASGKRVASATCPPASTNRRMGWGTPMQCPTLRKPRDSQCGRAGSPLLANRG